MAYGGQAHRGGDWVIYGRQYGALVADFTAMPLIGTVPLTVTLTGESTPWGTIDNYEWDYGDGVTSTTSAPTHTHTYTASGVYTVSLTVSGDGESDTLTRTNYVTVYPLPVTTIITYTYDPLYRLASASYSSGQVYTYTYDEVGNRTAMTDATGVRTYTYDAASRLTSVGGVAYTWDDNGNLRNNGVFTFTYDAANRLITVTNGATLTLGYRYNGDGVLVAQTANGVTTIFVQDVGGPLSQILVETSGGSTEWHLYGAVGVLAWTENGAWVYPLKDALGSVRQLTGQDGQVDDVAAYSPFGVPDEGDADAPHGYTGERWYGSVGLLFLRARWYTPDVGRFTQRDLWEGDLRSPQSLHLYAYVQNNAVNLTDPTGLVPYIPPELPNHRDLTYWLYDELSTNANGYYAQRIRTLLASSNLADRYRAIAAWIFLVKDQAKRDFKHHIQSELGKSIVLRHKGGYRWYEWSVPGNIFYAFVGRAVGWSGWWLHRGAAFAEIIDPEHAKAGEACCPVFCHVGLPAFYPICIPLGCYYVNPDWWRTGFDEPGDWWNVEFGVQLFNTYGTQLTFDQFQDFLAAHSDWLTPASTIPEWNWVNQQRGWPYKVGRFDGPRAGQYEPWVQLLLLGW